MATCIQCKEPKERGCEFVAYGGVVWCDLDCLAEYFLDREVELTDEKIAEIDEKYERRTAK